MPAAQVSEKLKSLALDLTKSFPRSPRETLGGYVLAARVLDKGRAYLNGTVGEYNYDCPLDSYFFKFTGIDSQAFTAYIATGASDEEVAAWIQQHSQQKDRLEVVKWNNDIRYSTPKDLPEETQLRWEDYIPNHMVNGKPLYYALDLQDLEEGRI